MKRALMAAIGLIAAAATLTACSHDSTSGSTPAASSTAAAGTASSAPASTAAAAGGNQVQVDGQPLAGLDPASVTCAKQAGKILIASGSVGGQQGLTAVLTDEATPQVVSLGLVVDGNALAVSDNMGMKVGSATVSVTGSTYAISGQAAGADLKNPMAGMITKPFSISVTCS